MAFVTHSHPQSPQQTMLSDETALLWAAAESLGTEALSLKKQAGDVRFHLWNRINKSYQRRWSVKTMEYYEKIMKHGTNTRKIRELSQKLIQWKCLDTRHFSRSTGFSCSNTKRPRPEPPCSTSNSKLAGLVFQDGQRAATPGSLWSLNWFKIRLWIGVSKRWSACDVLGLYIPSGRQVPAARRHKRFERVQRRPEFARNFFVNTSRD